MIRSSSNGGMIARPRSAASCSATAACRSDDDDLGAVRGDPLALDRRCVRRHDDDRRSAEQPGRPGHALGVVAGRVGDDAARQFVR
jgi:hypothetical protein